MGKNLRKLRWLLLGALPVVLGALLATVGGGVGKSDQAHADHTSIHVDVLARSGFLDEVDAQIKLRRFGTNPQQVVHVPDASDMVVLKLTVQPGAEFGWHTHPGPALVAISQGVLTITNATDCIARPYSAGHAFLDPGGSNVHNANNFGSEVVIAYVTFIGIPSGSGPTIPAADPGCWEEP